MSDRDRAHADIYREWLGWCRMTGLPAITTDTAARITAILCVHGENEDYVFNEKLVADTEYIQARFGLHGAGTPEPRFVELLKGYVKELRDYSKAHKDDPVDGPYLFQAKAPDWVKQLLRERYGIKYRG